MSRYVVSIDGVEYAVRATVDRADRSTNTPEAAIISSVTRDGAEIADDEFEPIASQLEDAVIEQWSAQRAADMAVRL